MRNEKNYHQILLLIWSCVFLFFIPCHTLVVGYYVFTLAVLVSIRLCPQYVRLSIRTSFPFDSLSIYKRISFKFCIYICTKNVSLGIINGQITIIYHRVMALVNVRKMVMASSSFTIWSIMMKLHKNDGSNKSCLLA